MKRKPKKVSPHIPVLSESDRAANLDTFASEATTVKGDRMVALKVLGPDRGNSLEEIAKEYEYDDSFKPGNVSNFRSVHTVPEIIAHLHECKETEVEGVFLEANSEGVYRYKKITGREKVLEAWKSGSKARKMREAKFREGFDNDTSSAGANSGLVGDDFVPLLGGPYNKQSYLYDYLRAHSYAFHEYHHHPFARAIVHMTRDFVLGGGYRIDCEDVKALALWRAFEKANGLEKMMEQVITEGSMFGENMIWWIPDMAAYIEYKLPAEQKSAKCLIPRIRLLDPSTCWEIVTFPEDINRILYYQFVFPTQYQIYTGSFGGKPVGSSKFVMQQLPPSDVMHFKYNCTSNEKRGRSDLFPVLGYLKWVRDCVNYKLIALKKQAAWTEDIEVQGNQTDVDNLARALNSLGPFEPAGSRFIHTAKVKRTYLANAMGHGEDTTIAHGVDMIAVGSGFPVTYFGLSKSSAQTRGSALVGTEPVAKKIERRQKEAKRILSDIWRKFQDDYGVKGAEATITFPEVIVQDRSVKLKDIKFAEDSKYFSHKRAAQMAAKEFAADDYDYEQEKKDIEDEGAQHINTTLETPLTAPALAGAGGAPKPPGDPTPAAAAPSKPSASPGIGNGSQSAVTSQDKREIGMKR